MGKRARWSGSPISAGAAPALLPQVQQVVARHQSSGCRRAFLMNKSCHANPGRRGRSPGPTSWDRPASQHIGCTNTEYLPVGPFALVSAPVFVFIQHLSQMQRYIKYIYIFIYIYIYILRKTTKSERDNTHQAESQASTHTQCTVCTHFI